MIEISIDNCSKLRIINCSKNQLFKLELKDQKNLRELYCSENKLISLDISGCSNLVNISCRSNQLINLDLSSQQILEDLLCFDNKISKLDVSGCANLQEIKCNKNQLTELNLGKLKKLFILDCQNNQLTQLETQFCPQLEKIYCNNNLLTALNLEENRLLKELNISDNKFQDQVLVFLTLLTKLEVLELNNNNFIGSLKPTIYLVELKKLDISNNNIDSGWEYLPDKLTEFYCRGSFDSLVSGIIGYNVNSNCYPWHSCNYLEYLQSWKSSNSQKVKAAKLTKSEEDRLINQSQEKLAIEREEFAKTLEKSKEWRERQIKEITEKKDQKIKDLTKRIAELESQLTQSQIQLSPK